MVSQNFRAGLLAVLVSFQLGSVHAMGQHAADENVFESFRVTLWVTDVRRSVEFYRTTLGFRLESYTVSNARSVADLAPSDPAPYAATLLFGEYRLGLQAGLEGERPVGARYVVQVSDPVTYASRVKERGGSISIVATTKPGAPSWFAVLDPDGHRFEFVGPTSAP